MLLDADMVEREQHADREYDRESNATQGSAARLPTISATRATTIAAAHGQRCSRHSSHGASPPQYCDKNAVPRTTTLANSTKPANGRGMRSIGYR